MGGKMFFEIPDDQEVMVKLVEAVPSTWSWVGGILNAPKTLINSGMALKDTGFTIQRFHDIRPTIVGHYDHYQGRRLKPDLFAIIVEQKFPGFIGFNEAGYDPCVVTLELAKRVAVGFLRKGYRGALGFFKGCYDNNKYKNAAFCSIEFQSQYGTPVSGVEAGYQPARVILEWNENFYGKEEDVKPILEMCRSLNLREYEPEVGDRRPA